MNRCVVGIVADSVIEARVVDRYRHEGKLREELSVEDRPNYAKSRPEERDGRAEHVRQYENEVDYLREKNI